MSFPTLWGKSELRKRILRLTAFGASMMLIILGISDYLGLRESANQTLGDRLVLARIVAGNVENLLRENLTYLQDVSFFPGFDLEDQDLDPEKSALHKASLQSICSNVFLLDRSGHLLWIEPQRFGLTGYDYGNYPPVREVLQTGKPIVSNLFEMNVPGKKAILLLLPVRRDSRILGIVGGEIDPTGDALIKPIQPAAIGATGYADVVDGNGLVVASTKMRNILKESDQGKFLAGLIKAGRPEVTECNDCRDAEGRLIEEIIAFVPLSGIAWGVAIRQTENEALAPVKKMETRFLTFGILLLLVTLMFTWGVAQSVIVPVQSLISSAKRISSGDLANPVASSGADEIGELGRTLDEMRVKLKDSLEEVGRVNQELEKRVEQRTSEVSLLYEELKRKEEGRSELLRKTISAQEEERKRIARELHDELSQSLTAILLALDSTGDAVHLYREEQGVVRNLALRAIDSVHRMIFDLRPAVLDDLGLPSAIKWYAEERLKSLGIQVHFEGEMFPERLRPEIETAVFRIAQEAITNIGRHAEAENVIISLDRTNGSITLEIEDDGKGFALEEMSQPKGGGRGLGLLGMRERALLLDGTLEIESEPGSGTRVLLEVPVTELLKDG